MIDRRRFTKVVAATATILFVSACQDGDEVSSTPGGEPGERKGVPTSSPTRPATRSPEPVTRVEILPVKGAKDVPLDAAVAISVTAGTIADVSVVADNGDKLAGTFGDGRATWTSDQALQPSMAYQITAKVKDAAGRLSTVEQSFHTLSPDKVLGTEIEPLSGQTVGVGMPQVTRTDLKTKRMNVYVDGKLARTIPVTGGKKDWETRRGTKVILEKRRDINFRNQAIGAPEEYNLRAPYGLRVTWSGEFLHSAAWSVASQGKRNVSHGCIGMNVANSKWLWSISQVGDPAETINTGGDPMPITGNGYGDWNLTWKEWLAGSVLGPTPGARKPAR